MLQKLRSVHVRSAATCNGRTLSSLMHSSTFLARMPLKHPLIRHVLYRDVSRGTGRVQDTVCTRPVPVRHHAVHDQPAHGRTPSTECTKCTFGDMFAVPRLKALRDVICNINLVLRLIIRQFSPQRCHHVTESNNAVNN